MYIIVTRRPENTNFYSMTITDVEILIFRHQLSTA